MAYDDRFLWATTGFMPTEDYNAIVSSRMSRAHGTGVFPLAAEKQAPDDLMEYINHSDIPAGATIMIIDEDRNGILHQITNRFFLTGFNSNYQEKAQLVETFGASTVSFFGDTAKIYQFSGQAVDYPSTSGPATSMQHTALTKLYDEHLRGTKLLKNKRIAVIKIFNHTVYGYPMRFGSAYGGQQDKLANFNMTWVVAKHDYSIPGLVENKDLEKSYSPREVLLQSSEMIARLNRIQHFLNVFEEAYTRETDRFGSSGELVYASTGNSTINLASELAKLQGQSADTIRARIKDIPFLSIGGETTTKTDQQRLDESFEFIISSTNIMLNHLTSLSDSNELPSEFNKSIVDQLKSGISSISTSDENLLAVVIFSAELMNYIRVLRKTERIILQGK